MRERAWGVSVIRKVVAGVKLLTIEAGAFFLMTAGIAPSKH